MKKHFIPTSSNLIRKIILISMIVFLGELLFSTILPVTGIQDEFNQSSKGNTLQLAPFLASQSASNGSPGQITKVFVRDHFSFPVVEQPLSNPGYVSSAADTLTRFRLASEYGSVGILAHNHLAGASFYELKVGDTINLFEFDGSNLPYLVIDIRQFQATIPSSAYSNFIDLADGTTYTASELFLDIYDQNDLLILQTCIEKAGDKSWGRYFVIAAPHPNYFQMMWYGFEHQTISY